MHKLKLIYTSKFNGINEVFDAVAAAAADATAGLSLLLLLLLLLLQSEGASPVLFPFLETGAEIADGDETYSSYRISKSDSFVQQPVALPTPALQPTIGSGRNNSSLPTTTKSGSER